MRLPVFFSITLCLGVVVSVDAKAMTRSILEGPDTVVRLEMVGDASRSSKLVPEVSRPAITEDQVRTLLSSISARKKVGLLQSFLGSPGAPRLFDEADLNLLVPPIREALANAASNEVVIFYREYRPGPGRIEVTSGSLFVRGDTFSLSVANLHHRVIAVPGQESSATGREERLQDVRQTPDYVREHPRLSVGEQDFAIFFDDPQYQAKREASLVGYPERTLEIAYKPFLAENPDPNRRLEEVQSAMQSAAMGNAERQAIAELRKKVTEMEAANKKALAEKLSVAKETPTAPPPHAMALPAVSGNSPAPPVAPSTDETREALTKLIDMVKRLDERMSAIEQQLRQKTPKKKK